MALVERLMHLNDDGTDPGEGKLDNIAVHTFFSAAGEIIAGGLTVAQVKAAFAMRTVNDASGKNDAAEFDALVALAPNASNPAGRALFLERVHGVFILAEVRFAGYNTPAAVRTKLGI